MDILKQTIKKRKYKIFNALIFAAVFSVFPMTIEYIYISILPTSYWFDYDKIIPVSPEFEVGEHPKFVSYAIIKRPVKIQWVDVMRCSLNNHDYFYRSYKTDAFIRNPVIFPRVIFDEDSGKDITSTWEYGYPVPNKVGTTCFIESNITAELPFGIKKTQHIKSDEFKVVKKK